MARVEPRFSGNSQRLSSELFLILGVLASPLLCNANSASLEAREAASEIFSLDAVVSKTRLSSNWKPSWASYEAALEGLNSDKRLVHERVIELVFAMLSQSPPPANLEIKSKLQARLAIFEYSANPSVIDSIREIGLGIEFYILDDNARYTFIRARLSEIAYHPLFFRNCISYLLNEKSERSMRHLLMLRSEWSQLLTALKQSGLSLQAEEYRIELAEKILAEDEVSSKILILSKVLLGQDVRGTMYARQAGLSFYEWIVDLALSIDEAQARKALNEIEQSPKVEPYIREIVKRHSSNRNP